MDRDQVNRTPEINFEQIRLYDNSRNTGFEELCCQLASFEPRSADATFFRKGRGGDAGVECFTRFADSSEIGWQAKYYFSWSSGLASDLDQSIRTALDKHPRLNEYVVCIPFDLSDARTGKGKTALEKWEAWRAKWEKTARGEKRSLKISLWSKSALAERLTRDEPAYVGRLIYWFDREALTPAWFRHQFEKARAGLGSRYTPETNVELPIRRDFLGFVRDPRLNGEVEAHSFEIQERGPAAVGALKRASQTPEKHSEVVRRRVLNLTRLLGVTPLALDRDVPLVAWTEAIRKALTSTYEAFSWARNLPEIKASGASDSPVQYAHHSTSRLIDALRDAAETFDSTRWRLTNARNLLLHGAAGTGKSHLLADVVEHQVNLERPALLVLGSALVEAEPWRQIMSQFDLPPGQQIRHFLAALDAAAQAAGTRALICIDALNERHGTDIWPSRLAAFLKEAAPFPRVAIALSCRSTYLPYVVPDSIPEAELARIEHDGFAGGGGEAARVYLDKRGIVRPGAPSLVPEFNNPLFLKTCCDFLEKDGKRELPKGLRGVTSIFGFYIDAVARALNTRMKLNPHAEVVPRAIRALAERYATLGTGYMPKADALALLDSIHPSGNLLESSLLAQLENEGVLAIEPVVMDDGTHGELVRFTFERFSDHAIASKLLDDHLDAGNVTASFADGTPLSNYILGDEAYERAGVIEAIAIQVPERTGVELPDAISPARSNYEVRRAYLESTLWREQKCFTRRTMELVGEFGGDDATRALLIAVATEPENIFNSRHLHKRLMAMEMNERDQAWSTYIAGLIDHGDDEGSNSLETLVSWAFANGMEAMDAERAELAAIALTWLFSTSHRSLRDRATKSLVCILAERLELAARLLKTFEGVNDLYVLERLLAAIYGAVLQGAASSGLGGLAETVYQQTFEANSVPLNALARDHALGVLRYTQWRGQLPASVDMDRARGPHRSPWPIEFVSDELIASYKENYGKGEFRDDIVGSVVNDGDYARYVVDYRVQKWSPAPLGTKRLPTYTQISRAWIKNFKATATPAQAGAFKALLAAAKARKGETNYIETPEKLALDAAEAAFRTTLTPDEWEAYASSARNFVNYRLFSPNDWKDRSAASFSTHWARRWICKRAHDLGWTSERFGTFDRYSTRDYNRHDHRIERIGKKYQWLALNDLIARMSDNLAFKGETYSDAGKAPKQYKGARQVGLRDIDPSLLVSRTYYDGWAQWPRTWWVPFEPNLRALAPKERLAWLESDQDIINDARLIDVTDPKTGRRWLALDGFAHWSQRSIVQGQGAMHRETWFRLKCVVAKKKDLRALVTFMAGKQLPSNHDLPELKLHGDHYLGEYPWDPSLAELDHWERDEWYGFPAKVRGTVADYTCERGGYDYSIEKSVSVTLPAPWLATALDLRLVNGRQLTFAGRDGRTIFFDPSVSEPGRQAALVDREAFLAMLSREGLAAIWVIAGEKSAYGGTSHSMGFGGRVSHTSVYELTPVGFVRSGNVKREEPSKIQFEKFFDGEDVDDDDEDYESDD